MSFMGSTTMEVYVILQFIMSNDEFMASTTTVYVNLQVIMGGDEFYGKYDCGVCESSSYHKW